MGASVLIWALCAVLIVRVVVEGAGNRARSTNWEKVLNVPDFHVALHFKNNAGVAARCRRDSRCPYKIHLDRDACWGYEINCSRSIQYSYPTCPGDHHGWVRSKAEQLETFFDEADFGYIRQRRKELFPVCASQHPNGATLECSEHLRFCRGRNLFFNFSSLADLQQPIRYRMDVIGPGEVGGFCTLDGQGLVKQLDHMSPLQSWAPELRHFTALDQDPITGGKCDFVVDEPTFLLKLDATVNMYHHFCDFFNLFATQHLNNSFSTHTRLLLWDTIDYRSNFEVTWKAFTRHPLQHLQQYVGKTVCFRDIVFPLLPRMIFGMYYNMPLISGCEGSGLFHAFAHHLLHRLQVGQNLKRQGKVRVTLLTRSTTYRRIMNQDQLVRALKAKDKDLEVSTVDFTWSMDFLEQLRVAHNTDILIGMHGAGLTHTLFLPDWAAVFEVYNCEDEGCYKDLARLRGVKYVTWEKLDKLKPQDKGHHPTEGAHAKFTNYEFDAAEFVRLVGRAALHVRSHPEWRRRVLGEASETRHPHVEL